MPRRCGAASYAAAPALTRNALLERAALDYAQDMATFGYMDHTGRDGSCAAGAHHAQRLPLERGRARTWRAASRARTRSSPAGCSSPEHCANLMDPAYSQMGVAYAVNPRDAAGIYWALEFGRPFGK